MKVAWKKRWSKMDHRRPWKKRTMAETYKHLTPQESELLWDKEKEVERG